MSQDLELLHKKVDFLTEQMLAIKRKQTELDELRQDLTPIATDIFKTAVDELEQISPYFSYEDLLFLLKKLLRNTRNFVALLDQIENATDFIKDATPLSQSVFQSLLTQLDEMERKGYFAFLGEAIQIIDRIVTSFTVEDVRKLGDNVVLIINTIKQLTQPEILSVVQNIISVYQHMNTMIEGKASSWRILKELRDDEVKRGILAGLAFLKNMTQHFPPDTENKIKVSTVVDESKRN